MPIYEYICEECNKQFEKMIFSQEDNNVNCPTCSSIKVSKQFSTFSAHGNSSPSADVPAGGCPSMMGGGCPSGGCPMAH
ncbi:MAG: zinc ribbon domain-containing protein [Nitrospinae bacterium]|nr:zinc ribbon domain-containing protein [Nitrospinota bacterium]